MRKSVLLLLCIFAFTGLKAQSILFDTQADDTTRYRIPAIVKTANGELIAFSDKRYATGDIGSGRLDIVARTLSNGSWSDERLVIAGSDTIKGFEKAHGDAAVVCDRETGKLLLMCASGSVGYGSSNRTNPLRVGRMTSEDGVNWTIEDVTDTVYSVNKAITRAFFSSGRICQSRYFKRGDYYRLYASITTNIGSIVVYSDDFGESWTQLGGTSARPAKNGDEAKVEELPNGSVLLSSRMSGGRYFNIFRYDDDTLNTGSWDTVASSTSEGGTISKSCSCNGEILLVPALRTADNQEVYIALQSVPFGAGRTNVGIYYKELASYADYDEATDFNSGWSPVEVTDTTSAYSTMVLDEEGKIAFIYENVELNNGYDIVYQSFSLSELTSDAYVYNPNPTDNITFVLMDKMPGCNYYDLSGRRLLTAPKNEVFICEGRARILK